MLQLDITNAFNSCDRARMLRGLYALPELQTVYRIVDLAYSQPNALVLGGCDGLMVQSAQGVRQGDPLSALLFCVYMKEQLQKTSEATGARVYGFFDDISLLGTPQQLMEALSHLQRSLPSVSLQLNTSKSHFTYFHQQLTPLTASTLGALSAADIQLHHDWTVVMGAAVGRDDAAIRAGMHHILSGAGSHDAFLRRIQMSDMPIQSAMLLLRMCLVPAVNYYLRCIAPTCIEDETFRFDSQVLEAAMTKLGLDGTERSEQTTTLLQRKLRHGGWSLTSAAHTSPAAYLGSLAACHGEPVFAEYRGATPVPPASLLHGWIEDSMQRIQQAAQGDEYRCELGPLLPTTAGVFFSFCATSDPSTTVALQHSLNAKATAHIAKAAVQESRSRARQGERWQWAHHRAITAKGAWGWKVVRPEDPQLRLSDTQYAIAARLSLALPPFPPSTMRTLPDECPLCTHRKTGAPVSLAADPWHWLSCSDMMRGELTRRHDAVVDAVCRIARQVGAQVKTEVRGLDPHSNQRPDIMLVFPGRVVLADVSVSHSLTPAQITNGSAAASQQSKKNAKYAAVASRLGAELLNLAVDSCGGMALGASRLIEAIAEEGARWSAGTWTESGIQRQLLGAIATAVQRGNGLAMLAGYTRAAVARVRQEVHTSVESASGSASSEDGGEEE